MDKRIVLENTNGVMAGVFQIMGLESDAPKPLPEFVPEVEMRDHIGPASLIGVKRSHVLYREIFTPEMQNGKEFNRSQQ
jgi:hypothetical protein